MHEDHQVRLTSTVLWKRVSDLIFGYGLDQKEIATKWKRTLVESNVWSSKIPSDGQDSEISELGNLDEIGAGLTYNIGVSNTSLRRCTEP